MSAQVEAGSPPAVQSRGFMAGIGELFESFVSWVMVGLMVVGVVTLALTWRTSDIAFMPAGELRVTQSTWWGFNKEETKILASPVDGWMVKSGDDLVQMKHRAIRLRN